MRSDGTAAGSVAFLKQPDQAADAYGFTNVNGKVIFSNRNSAAGRELWSTTGRTAGTALLRDIYVGSDFSSTPGLSAWHFGRFEVVGTRAIFAATNNVRGREPWSSDGTGVGTKLVKDHAAGSANAFSNDGNMAGNGKFALYVASDSQVGSSLWATDGTPAGTRLIKRLDYLSLSPKFGLLGPNRMLFIQNDGRELWVTDGTAAGTKLVKAFPRRRDLGNISWLPGRAFALLSVATSAEGRELWITNGTASGTKLLKNIMLYSGNSDPMGYTEVAGHIVFTAVSDGEGRELWATDGTPATTKRIAVLNPGKTATAFFEFTRHRGKVYFWARADVSGSQRFPYVTDGTAAGTRKISNFAMNAEESGNYAKFVSLGDRLVYLGVTKADQSDVELWSSTDVFNSQKKLTSSISGIRQYAPLAMRAVQVPSFDGKNRPCPE